MARWHNNDGDRGHNNNASEYKLSASEKAPLRRAFAACSFSRLMTVSGASCFCGRPRKAGSPAPTAPHGFAKLVAGADALCANDVPLEEKELPKGCGWLRDALEAVADEPRAVELLGMVALFEMEEGVPDIMLEANDAEDGKLRLGGTMESVTAGRRPGLQS